jgi:hypothetical protein
MKNSTLLSLMFIIALCGVFISRCTCCFRDSGIKYHTPYNNYALGTGLALEFHPEGTWSLVAGTKMYSGNFHIDKDGHKIFLSPFPDYFTTIGEFREKSDTDETRLEIPKDSLRFGGIEFLICECGEVLDIGDGMSASFRLVK